MSLCMLLLLHCTCSSHPFQNLIRVFHSGRSRNFQPLRDLDLLRKPREHVLPQRQQWIDIPVPILTCSPMTSVCRVFPRYIRSRQLLRQLANLAKYLQGINHSTLPAHYLGKICGRMNNRRSIGKGHSSTLDRKAC